MHYLGSGSQIDNIQGSQHPQEGVALIIKSNDTWAPKQPKACHASVNYVLFKRWRLTHMDVRL
jgi:hypothetical protein